MAIGKVTEFTGETVGMIAVRRWSNVSIAVLTVAVVVVFDWRMAFFFLALAWTVRLETKRVRQALWPESYNAMRWIMDEHGFEHDGEPHIYAKHRGSAPQF